MSLPPPYLLLPNNVGGVKVSKNNSSQSSCALRFYSHIRAKRGPAFKQRSDYTGFRDNNGQPSLVEIEMFPLSEGRHSHKAPKSIKTTLRHGCKTYNKKRRIKGLFLLCPVVRFISADGNQHLNGVFLEHGCHPRERSAR